MIKIYKSGNIEIQVNLSYIILTADIGFMKKTITISIIISIFLIFWAVSCSDTGSVYGYAKLTISTLNYSPGGVSDTATVFYTIVSASDHSNILYTGNVTTNNQTVVALIDVNDLPADKLVHILVVYDADGNLQDSGDPYQWYESISIENNATGIDLSDNRSISISFDDSNTL